MKAIDNKILHVIRRVEHFCSKLYYLFLFKNRFTNANRRREEMASSIIITAEEQKAIDDVWKGIRYRPSWFKWYKQINERQIREEVNTCIDEAPGRLASFIPDNLFFLFFCEYYSVNSFAHALDDKNYYDLFFHDISQPETIVRKMDGLLFDSNYNRIDIDQAVRLIKSNDSSIMKPSILSSGGKGIVFFNHEDDPEIIKYELAKRRSVIVQKSIAQHEILGQIHEESINTIRTITFFHHNRVNVLSSVLRMGVGNSRVDNSSSGGIFCGISNSGLLKKFAYNSRLDSFESHPSSGVSFSSITVPGFEKTIALTAYLANRFVNVSKLLSWDIAIGKDGEPILIEVNLIYGDIDFHQIANGPLFGEMTQEVVAEVFSRKNRRLNRFFY